MNRRDFVMTQCRRAMRSPLAAAPPDCCPTAASLEAALRSKRSIKKGIMWGTVGVKGSVLEKMKAVKAAGFEGVEMNSHMDQDEVVRARDATGLEIPSVCGAHHWDQTLSDPDPKVREEGLGSTEANLARRQTLWRLLGSAGPRAS